MRSLRSTDSTGVTADRSSASAAEALAQARLSAIIESSDDAIVSKDLNGTIMTWHRAAERIFGYTAHEAIGQPVTMLICGKRQYRFNVR